MARSLGSQRRAPQRTPRTLRNQRNQRSRTSITVRSTGPRRASRALVASFATVGLTGLTTIAVPTIVPSILPTASATTPKNQPAGLGVSVSTFPYNPTSDTGAAQWSNPNARSTDPQQSVTVEVLSATPTVVTTDSSHVSYSLRITNNRLDPISDLSLRLFYANPATTGPTIRLSQLTNQGEFPFSSNLDKLSGTIDPGQSRDVTVSIPLDPSFSDATTLALPAPGISGVGAHPLLFSLSGTPRDQGGSQLLGVTRATLSMVASKKEKQDQQGQADQKLPTPVTVIYPLAAETNSTAGATGDAPQRATLYLSNEELADQLRPGGRLRDLLDAYRDAVAKPDGAKLRQATCIGIDPELLDTVDRMAGGYTVGTEIPDSVEEPKRLRDSWGEILGRDKPKTSPGQGADVAAAWLADLRSLVENNCSVALPYAGADINTLAGANNEWLSVLAYGLGSATLERVLGQVPMKNVVIPGGGYVTEQAVPLLAAGASGGVDENAPKRFEATVAAQSALPTLGDGSEVTTLVADNTVQVTTPGSGTADDSGDGGAGNGGVGNGGAASQRPNDLVAIANGTRALTYSADLGAALMATGTQPQVAPFSNPDLRYTMEQDSPASRMSNAVAVLDQQVSSGTPVVAVPPALWSVSKQGATTFLDTVAAHFADDSATPRPLSAAVSSPPEGVTLPQGTTLDPYSDVGEASPEFVRAIGDVSRQVRDLTLLMRNDPAIAVTREVYTRPLFSDVLHAASSYRTRVRSLYVASRQAAINRLDTVATVVRNLRSSIALLPPGNVFTRTSDSSPLLVVARNGLPLPVPAQVDYHSDATTPVTVTLPEEVQLIPAKGSITLSLTTDMQDPSGTTDLSLWLAAPPGSEEARDLAESAGAANDQLAEADAPRGSLSPDQDPTRISAPVELRVQSVPGMSGLSIAAIVGGLALIAVAGKIVWSRRSGSSSRRLKRLNR